MRRNLFAKSPDVDRPASARTSAREALMFDLRDHTESAELNLAERRVGGWTFAPWLVFGGHLVLAITLLLEHRPGTSWSALAAAFVPLGTSLALDAAAGGLMLLWRRLQIAPHTIVRIMCGYLAATGGAWTMAAVTTGSFKLADASFVTIALCAGFFLRSVVAVPKPPLALVNAAVAVATTALFSSDLQVTFAIDAIAALMIVYSVAITQKSLFEGRRRLALEWQAKKALNFVDEFENSGRGWFWETDSLGTLSYVSRQLSEDFQCEPEALLGRRFTDLLSVDQASDSMEERKTLGFHLSARFPFPTWSSCRRANRTFTGRCRGIRSSMSVDASSASEESAPTSPSSASRSARSRGLLASIR